MQFYRFYVAQSIQIDNNTVTNIQSEAFVKFSHLIRS